MKTYQYRIGEKNITIMLSLKKATTMIREFLRVRDANRISLADRGGYCMELWAASPQWELSTQQKADIVNFFQHLPNKITTANYDATLAACEQFAGTFRACQLAAGFGVDRGQRPCA